MLGRSRGHLTDEDIDDWLYSRVPAAWRTFARTLAVCLREYGWFITDTGGIAKLQIESSLTGDYGPVDTDSDDFRDLLDGLLSPERIYAVVPSDQYP